MISWFSGVGVRSVIVFMRVSFEEYVPHTRQDVECQGWTLISLNEIAYTGRLQIGSQTYFVEVLGGGPELSG
jgi:hypothetical protein